MSSALQRADSLLALPHVSSYLDTPIAPVGTTSDATAVRPAPRIPTPGDEQRDANPLEQVLDLLSRPNYAVAGATRSALAGMNPLEGAGRGLSGQDRTTFGDILREEGGMNPALAGFLGFGLDVVTDPTNLIGVGGLTKAAKAMKTLQLAHDTAIAANDLTKAKAIAAEMAALGDVAGQRRLINWHGPLGGIMDRLPTNVDDAVFAGLGKVGTKIGDMGWARGLKKAFVNGAPNDTMRAFEQGAKHAFEHGVGQFSEAAKPYVKRLQQAARDLGPKAKNGVLDEALSLITELHVPTKLNGLDPDDILRHMPQADRAEFKKLLALEKDARVFGGVVDASALTAAEKERLKKLLALQERLANGVPVKGPDGKVYKAMPGHFLAQLRKLQSKLKPTQFGSVDDLKAAKKALTEAAQKNLNAKEMADTIANVRKVYGFQPDLFDDFANDFVTFVNATNSGLLKRTKRAGITIDALEGQGYLRHLITPEARKVLVKQHGAQWYKKFTEVHGAQLERQFHGMTVYEVNQLARKGKLPGFEGIKFDRFFESNPLLSTAFRAGEAERAIEAANLFDRSLKLWGKLPPGAKSAPADWVELQTNIPKLKGKKLPPEIAHHLNKTFESINNPDDFLNKWDVVNDVWKRYTLGVFPVYHTRNLIGDFFNAVVLGGTNPMHIVEAVRMMATNSKDPLIEMASKLGVMSGSSVDEFNRRVLREVGQKNSSVYEHVAHNKVIEMALQAGQWRENTTRLGMFIDRIRRGMPPEQAALEVKKYLFDFRDLTDFEKKGMRRVFPFYSWLRKNIPLQMEHLFSKPGVYAGIQHARDEAAGEDDLTDSQLPQFLRGGLPIRMGHNSEGLPQYMPLRNNIPGADLVSMHPGGVFEEAMRGMSPFISAPLEMASGFDLSRSGFGEMGTLDKGGTDPMRSVLGFEVPARATPLIDMVRGITELNKLNPGGVFGSDTEPGIGGALRDYPDPDEALRWMAGIVGRPYAIDSGRESHKEAVDRRQRIARLRKALGNAKGPDERAAIMKLIEEATR